MYHLKKETEYKNGIQTITKKLELKDKDLSDLGLKMSQLNGELISKDLRIQNLDIETKELREQHAQLNETIADFETKKIEFNAKLEALRNNEARSESEKETEIEKLARDKETLECDLTKSKLKIQAYSDEKLQWLNEKVN